jgi:hypothetical protein
MRPSGPSRRRGPFLAALAAPLALAAVPAALSAAPVIATDATCLRPGQEATGGLISPPLNVTGSGFSPNAAVRITRGASSRLAFVGADGTFAEQVSVLDRLTARAPRAAPLDVVAVDPILGASNTLRIWTAPLAFAATPKQTRPSATVTFRFSGFAPDGPIYAHYRFGGKLRATVSMGRASDPCGLLTAKRDQIPVRDANIGRWKVQFSQSKTFRARTVPRIDATVNVFRSTATRRP